MMTTATLATGMRTMDTVERPRRSLEELVDRLFDALLEANTEMAEPGATRSIHEARRLRQVGNMDGALDILSGINMGKAEKQEARWAFSEWKGLVTRRFSSDVLLYSQSLWPGYVPLIPPPACQALDPWTNPPCANLPTSISCCVA